MKEEAIEKPVCKSCGADVREGTTFCYSCGKRVADDPADNAADAETVAEPAAQADAIPKPDAETEAEIAKQFKVDEAVQTDRLAEAAAKRKASRVGLKKPPSDMVWEPADGVSPVFIGITLIITVIALGVVFLAVYLK